MTVAFLFPGQGEQVPGMLGALPETDTTRAILAAAAPLRDDAEALAGTYDAQVDLYIAAIAWCAALGEHDINPDFVAGHSVGSFAAAVAAGVLEFEEGLSAVRLRAELMARDFGDGYGMVAILGLGIVAVRRLVDQLSSADNLLFVALINARDQIVVTGSEAALTKVVEAARAAGARDAKRLAVSTLSHCSPLAEVGGAVGRMLMGVPDRVARIPYWQCSLGRLTDDRDAIFDDLALGVAQTVHWDGAVEVMNERGVDLFVALLPGDSLARLAAQQVDPRRVLVLDGMSLKEAIARYRRLSG